MKNEIKFDKIVIPAFKRVFPSLILHEIAGVQPMSGPTGLAFAYRNKFEEEKVKPVRIIGKSMPEYKDVLGVIKSYKNPWFATVLVRKGNVDIELEIESNDLIYKLTEEELKKASELYFAELL